MSSQSSRFILTDVRAFINRTFSGEALFENTKVNFNQERMVMVCLKITYVKMNLMMRKKSI